MITKITYKHFCDLGALCNPNCFTRTDNNKERYYYYMGNLSEACWMGWNKKSPGLKTK